VIIGIIIIVPKLVQKVIAGYDMLIIASYLWSMSYKSLAELYSSHRIPIAPFGIGRDEILPGSLQVQYPSLAGSLSGLQLCNYSLRSPWLYLLSL